MPETSISAALDAATVINSPPGDPVDLDRYRPKASTREVHDAVISSLARVVGAAVRTAAEFVSLAEFYDRDATTAIRLGHLVDASECVEIAMTHLGQLKAAMSYRLRTEDEQNTGESPF